MDTKMANAEVAAPIVKNKAEAKVGALLKTNEAKMEAYFDVTKSEADSYKIMKDKLNYSDDKALLNYIKVKTIANFNQKNLIVKVEDLWKKFKKDRFKKGLT